MLEEMTAQRGAVADEGLLEPLRVWGRLVNGMLTIVNTGTLRHHHAVLSVFAELLEVLPKRTLREE